MLVLSRKIGERVTIGDDIVVTVIQVGRDRIRLGFDCPPKVRVLREELKRREEVRTSQSRNREPDVHELCTCSML